MKHDRNAIKEPPMPKQHIELFLDGIVLIINPPLLHVSFSRPQSPHARARLGPPRLFRGLRADHLTIPLEPLAHGPNRGKLNVHLTYGNGPDAHRETIALLSPTELVAAFKPASEEVLRFYLSIARPVTWQSLRNDGYSVLLPSEEAEAQLDERLARRRWRFRLTKQSFQALISGFELYDPELLVELEGDAESRSLTVFNETTGDAYCIGYQSFGLGPDRPPGWYAIPLDDSVKRLMDGMIPQLLGPTGYETVRIIARELEADIDLDAAFGM
jgi:hypothetical protein